MPNVVIETPQNIAIHYEPASVGDRILAWLIDFLIFLGYGAGWFILSREFPIGQTEWILVMLPAAFYHLAMEVFNNGQSLGKMSASLKVIHQDGSSPSLGSFLIRWLFRLVENVFFFFGCVPVLTMMLGNRGQRLGDVVAGTTVVKLKKQMALSGTLYEEIPPDYRPQFKVAQINHLREQDVRLIKRFLLSNAFEKKQELVDITADKVKKATGIETTLAPNAFLKQVIKDYNYYYQKEE